MLSRLFVFLYSSLVLCVQTPVCDASLGYSLTDFFLFVLLYNLTAGTFIGMACVLLGVVLCLTDKM